MALEEVHRYLGVQQNRRYNHKEVKSQVTMMFKDRLQNVVLRNLNAKNLTKL